MSPVSLHENSEPGDDEREREDRRPCFSSKPSNPWLGFDRLAVDNVCNGICAGRREDFEEGMLKVVELFSSSPIHAELVGGEEVGVGRSSGSG